ncbi:Holliday junction branch migration protein RuvA [Candidatus Desulforudis audaxviator]|uniref:Holliday junction branch migration complex subunit RuvA n=1 Tax=Desulforudis audaxviator (strain MP104C) TaxID=477974 RepID=RUVA_DESAP|nr:Holliday junction branch migration protein RuvA [Candidatus Desulforudis audaxviator]B1I477.1 RecName: Full=Holliday junction branch migration complex subunit RuvA [Candidatus Desulforudis audaxviator MP104C]ACA59872.1 Holliday junction DNA helicase RuvA [Candidatus Desulforudis audaxviator MP104C]AZK59877.1 Holliday junction DNA helicase RuvA [Candidatus Desulforudis audaxviator]
MIDFLKGRLVSVYPEAVVVEVGGIGYRVQVPPSLAASLPEPGETVFLYTYLSVKETALEMFGFSSELDRTAFLLLLGVAGIGPRTALAVVGRLGTRRLWAAILREDTGILTTVPGIGVKSARRIMVELRDRLEKQQVAVSAELPASDGVPVLAGRAENEALAALISLGYTPREAREALNRLPDRKLDAAGLVHAALRIMGSQ